jgi:HSF-type DNA-binding
MPQLMKVLSNRKFAHIITWTPSGKAFSILKPKLFANEILPDHFKSAKYSSFTRKMHRWGFMRHYRGEESGAFYHKDFQRDCLDLVETMTCQKAPETHKASPLPASSVESALSKKKEKIPPKASLAATASSSSGVSTDRSIKSMASLQDRMQRPVAINAHPLHRSIARRPLAMPPQVVVPHGMGVARRPPAVAAPVPRAAVAMPNPMTAALRRQQVLRSEMAPPPPSSGVTPESIFAAAKLNAAIEMEVSRRLQERITEAAARMSRAGVLGNLLQTPAQPHPSSSSAAQQMAAALNGGVGGGASATPSAALRAKLMQMQQQKEQLQYLAMIGALPTPGQGLGELPKTNIQGAKTA